MRSSNFLKIWGLGEFIIEYEEQVIRESDWKSQKALKLFKYFLLDIDRVKKDEILVDVFWPDYDFDRGKKRLYDTVYQLRKFFDKDDYNLDESIVLKKSNGYKLNDNWNFWLDWQEFSNLYWSVNYDLKKDDAISYNNLIYKLNKALDLYRDDFMSGDNYESWTEVAREQYREMYMELLLNIAKCYYVQKKYDNAIIYLKKGIREEPYREEFYLLAMKVLKKENRLGEAVKIYEKCHEILKSELNIAPSKELQEVYKDIQENELTLDEEKIFAGLKQSGETKSSFICNKKTFITVLELEKRHAERAGSSSLFLRITFADDFPDIFLEKLIFNIAMLLRKDDVITKWSNKKIYIILNNTSYSNREKIIKRLKELEIWQSVVDMTKLEWFDIKNNKKGHLKIVNESLDI